MTLELTNVATLPIKLWPGMKIGQLCLFRTSPPPNTRTARPSTAPVPGSARSHSVPVLPELLPRKSLTAGVAFAQRGRHRLPYGRTEPATLSWATHRKERHAPALPSATVIASLHKSLSDEHELPTG